MKESFVSTIDIGGQDGNVGPVVIVKSPRCTEGMLLNSYWVTYE